MAGAWYVGRASWRRRWQGLVFLGLVAGLIGGAVLGAAAGARRTSTVYDRLLAKSKAPHEVLFVTKNLPEIEGFLRQASSVDHFDRAAGMVGRRAPGEDWYSLDAFYNGSLFPETVLERGRRPNFDRADEVLTTVRTAKNAGLDVGDELTFAAYDATADGGAAREPVARAGGPTRVGEDRRHRARSDRRAALADDQVALRHAGVCAEVRERSGVDVGRGLVEGRSDRGAPVRT